MQTPAPKTGLCLMNLGTPDAPETAPVRRYLREFLGDPRVLDMPAWKRSLILNLFILPTRPKKSAEAYREVWTERGSPLLFHTEDLRDKVQERLGDAVHVEIAMRYGTPDFESALGRFRDHGVDRIALFPLYPQYASSSTGTAIADALAAISQRWNTPFASVVPPFYDHPAFIAAVRAVAAPVLAEARPERVVFSYHGLPERHVQKSDDSPDRSHCLVKPGCCDTIGFANRNCYRAQCVQTTKLLGDALGIPEEQRVLAFQSRLGRDPWIQPYADETIRGLATAGVKRVAVMSPAFVADCLETLEEIAMQAKEDFEAHGGDELVLVPSLNATDAWADAVCAIARDTAAFLPRAAATAKPS